MRIAQPQKMYFISDLTPKRRFLGGLEKQKDTQKKELTEMVNCINHKTTMYNLFFYSSNRNGVSLYI